MSIDLILDDKKTILASSKDGSISIRTNPYTLDIKIGVFKASIEGKIPLKDHPGMIMHQGDVDIEVKDGVLYIQGKDIHSYFK